MLCISNIENQWIYYYLAFRPDFHVLWLSKTCCCLNNNLPIYPFTAPISSTPTGWTNWPINDIHVSNLNWQQFPPCHYIHAYSVSTRKYICASPQSDYWALNLTLPSLLIKLKIREDIISPFPNPCVVPCGITKYPI